MKQEVSEETALGIGFYPEILNKISGDIVFEAFKEISLNGWINSETSNSAIENMVITESIKKMGYQEFKEVMPYLIRRAQENTSVAGQTGRELSLIEKEIKRRKKGN